MKRKKSIKTKVLAVLFVMQLPLILMIVIYNIYFVNFFNQKISESNRNALGSYCNTLERVMKNLNDRMLNFITQDTDFKMLVTDMEYLDAHVHSLSVIEYFENLEEENDLLYGCYIIQNRYSMFRECYEDFSRGNYYMNEKLREFFEPYMYEEGKIMDHLWKPLKIDDSAFLYMVKGYGGTYTVMLLDVSRFYTPQDEAVASGDGMILLFSENDVLNPSEAARENGIRLLNRDDYYFSGEPQKYLIIEQPVAGASVRSAYLMKYKGFLGSLSSLQRWMVIFSIILVTLILPAGYYVLKRVFFKPVDRLVHTMDAIRGGQMETRAEEDYSELEFLKMNQTFNAMLTEINKLKIESYEKEIDLQKIQLDYFQTQIRPHFYVNCLKSVYGMLEEGRESDAKQSIVDLSKHLRYMLKGPSIAVAMEEELLYVRNYIELQTIGMAYPPKLHVEIEDALKAMNIPAISLLTFVENSVKYGGLAGKSLRIGIYIGTMLAPEANFVNISISDNGPGFGPEMLEQLNNYETSAQNGHNVGIYNVIQRLILYYGREHVLFAFSDRNGAHVDIFISKGEKSGDFMDKGEWL